MPDEGDRQPGLKPRRLLPDFAICRARRLANSDLAYCLVDAPYDCKHAVSFGSSFFCLHPERDGIISRTEANQVRD